MQTEAEIRAMQPQAKENAWGHRKLEGARKDSPYSLQREYSPVLVEILESWPPEL